MLFRSDRILAFVDELLAAPEADRPIIVIGADEGPYPDGYAKDQVRFDWSTATTDDLEIKYGILLSFYLPGVPMPGAIAPYDRMTSVNTWPVVLSHAFAGPWTLSPDRGAPLVLPPVEDPGQRLGPLLGEKLGRLVPFVNGEAPWVLRGFLSPPDLSFRDRGHLHGHPHGGLRLLYAHFDVSRCEDDYRQLPGRCQLQRQRRG